MNLDGLLDARTARELGAAYLLEAIAPAGDFGRRARERERPFRPGDEAAAQHLLDDVRAAAAALDASRIDAVRAAIRAIPDATIVFERARLAETLDDVDFFEIARFLDAVAALASAVDGTALAGRRPPPFDELRAQLAPGRSQSALGTGFTLGDAFDPQLAKLRAELAHAEQARTRARERQADAAASVLGAAALRDGEFIVMRAQYDGALPEGVRAIRETPTYRLCAIEADDASLEAERVHDAALAALAACESAVRVRLTHDVAAAAETAARAAALVGELDAFVGRVRFARLRASASRISADGEFALDAAAFPPLEAALAAAGRRYVPISVALAGTAVLTGPNMGGKSAALRTCGFAALCVALGVPPPARAAAVPLFARIAWIGGGEAASLLSSFGEDVAEIRDVMRGGVDRALVLVDEFARTTTPREGRALAIGLASVLAERRAHALVATHFPGVARDARVRHLAVAGVDPAILAELPAGDTAAALAALGDAMDYRIIEVGSDERGGEDALALARLLGLDPAILERAREALRDSG